MHGNLKCNRTKESKIILKIGEKTLKQVATQCGQCMPVSMFVVNVKMFVVNVCSQCQAQSQAQSQAQVRPPFDL